MLEQYLQNLGLSEKEAKVYLALLQVDRASASEIAQSTDIKRPTVYVMIESLENKGLVSETMEGKRTRYQAEPPERLETYVENRKRALEEQSNRLESDVIPQLKSMQREEGERPVVKYFEGKEGALSAIEELFRGQTVTEDYTYLIYSKDLIDKHFSGDQREKYRDVRLDKGIQSRVLYTCEEGELPSDDTGERYQLDAEQYPIKCDISIYKDRVRINTLGEQLAGIVIYSKDVADTLRSLFEHSFACEKKKGSDRQ